jgi:hypothetical protein
MRGQGRAARAGAITRQLLAIQLPVLALWTSFAVGPSCAADLVWEVEYPFRFFKPTKSFALQAAFNQVHGDPFQPYSPAATLPYAHRWRLFRTPNDAFLTANTHREGASLFDILQPAYAGLYSGAIHPTAEAHAIVADHVIRHVRAVVDKLPKIAM